LPPLTAITDSILRTNVGDVAGYGQYIGNDIYLITTGITQSEFPNNYPAYVPYRATYVNGRMIGSPTPLTYTITNNYFVRVYDTKTNTIRYSALNNISTTFGPGRIVIANTLGSTVAPYTTIGLTVPRTS
jgi:hypothetical protein